MLKEIEAAVRDIKDFPKPGIIFKDVTPLLKDPKLLKETAVLLAAPWKDAGITVVAAIDARGFIFGTLLAAELNAALVPIRKKGKLPYSTVSAEYDLEYGSAAIEMHTDAVAAGDKVLIADDVLATGGTASAAGRLITETGAKIAGYSFLMELTFLNGIEKLDNANVEALLKI